MEKFSKAINVLEREKQRIVGKYAIKYPDLHLTAKNYLKWEQVKLIQEAIELLKSNGYQNTKP